MHVARANSQAQAHADAPSRAQLLFVAQKKCVALGLGALLLIMAAYNLSLIGIDFYHVAVTGQEVRGPCHHLLQRSVHGDDLYRCADPDSVDRRFRPL
jgi:hypothetical protein